MSFLLLNATIKKNGLPKPKSSMFFKKTLLLPII